VVGKRSDKAISLVFIQLTIQAIIGEDIHPKKKKIIIHGHVMLCDAISYHIMPTTHRKYEGIKKQHCDS